MNATLQAEQSADTRPTSRRGVRFYFGVGAAIVISGSLFAAVASQLETPMVVQQLREASIAWIAVAMLIAALVLILRTARLVVLLPQIPYRDGLIAVALQSFLVRVTPMRLGELALPYSLRVRAGIPVANSLIALLLLRLLDFSVLLLVAATAVIGWFGYNSGNSWALGTVAVASTLVALGFRSWLATALRIVRFLVQRTPAHRIGALTRLLSQLMKATEHGFQLSLGRMAVLISISLTITLLLILMFWALLVAFHVDLELRQVLIGVSAAQIAGILPFATVGSIGTHEAGWTAAFVWVGLSRDVAALTGLVTQLVTILQSGVLAGFAQLFGHRHAPHVIQTRC